MSDRLVYYIADGLARHDREIHGFERPTKFYLDQAEDYVVSYSTYRAKQERVRRSSSPLMQRLIERNEGSQW